MQFSHDLRWSFERFYCASKGAFTQQFDQSLWNLEKSNETQYIPINLIKLTYNPQNSQNLGKTNKNRNTYFQALWRGSMQESLMFFVFSIFFLLGLLILWWLCTFFQTKSATSFQRNKNIDIHWFNKIFQNKNGRVAACWYQTAFSQLIDGFAFRSSYLFLPDAQLGYAPYTHTIWNIFFPQCIPIVWSESCSTLFNA